METSKEATHVPESTGDYRLYPGALWITSTGVTLRISGFHDRWLTEHPDISHGARNVAEFILATGWTAVTLFGEGYLELIIRGGRDPESRDLAFEVLSRNRPSWSKAVLMALDCEGQASVRGEDFADRRRFEDDLDRVWPGIMD